MSLSKPTLFENPVSYVGRTFPPAKVAADNENIDAVGNYVPPANQVELQSILGLCSVYRHFASSFTRVACSLSIRTRGIEPCKLRLNVVELDGFQKLKKRLMSPSILL